MEAGTVTFSDFIQFVKRTVAHILTGFFSSALGARASAFLESEAKKFNTKADDPRFLVNVIIKRWRQEFESQIPFSASLPTLFEEVRNLFNLDAHSGQESWLKINYYVESLLAGLEMLSSFPGSYISKNDTAAALASIKDQWIRVDKSGNALNSDFKWEARFSNVYLPGLDSEELTVIISQVVDSATADKVESAISITLDISPSSCKKLPNGTFEVSFSSAKDLNDFLTRRGDLRVKNKAVSVSKKQVPKEIKYVIRNPPSDISIDLFKNGIELNLDCSVIEITKNASGELEIVFPDGITFEQREVTIRKQKILLERKIFSALNAQTKILVYGPLSDYDTHKIEGVLDNILDVKCNAVKSEDDAELAVLFLSRETDLVTVLEHNNKKLPVAKNIWYFEPYCEHILKVVNIPIGAKSEHIATALANSAPECKLVYYDDKQKVCYLHCASVESKDKLLLKGTLPLLSSKPAIKSTTAVQTKEAAKPDPMPVVVDGTTASFKDSNDFVSVVSGNGMTDITFLHKGNLSRIKAKGFSHISTLCDAKGIKHNIVDGSRMQFSTAVPADVKEIMNVIQDQLKNREKDCVTVGEVARVYTPIFKLMAKHFTSTTNCVVTIGSKPGKLNNQLDFVEIFLFGFKADIVALKQVLSTMKHPISQDVDISNEDAKLLADMPETLDAIKEQHFADIVIADKVTVRALSVQYRDQAWQAALAELKQRKEATKLLYPHCILDFFDNYMRSDFQKDMYQKQLGGVTILTRGDKFIFNGPQSVVEKVKAELQGRLAGLTSQNWHEQMDADLARHVFSTKKIQQILRENEVSYFFMGKMRSAQTTEKKTGRTPKKNVSTSNSHINKPNNNNNNKKPNKNYTNKKPHYNKTNKTSKNNNGNRNRDNDVSINLTKYYNKNATMRDISFACQDANKLANCLKKLKEILQIQSVPLDVNFGLTKFIVRNIKDIESKYKVIIRKNPYTGIASSSGSDSDSSDSESDSDDSDASDACSTASSDAFSDAPKKVMNQCHITGMARNTSKAIDYIKEYEKNLSWQQMFRLPAPQFKYVEKFKKNEVNALCKKFNINATWPVPVKPASSPSTSKYRQHKQNSPAIQKNALSIKGKKGDVEAFMQEMSKLAQGLYERSVQVASTVPLPVLLLEKEENASQYRVVITVTKAKAVTSTSDDISDNDSDEDGETAQNQSQHTVVVVGSNLKAVSDASDAMSGPYATEEPKYTQQQFNLLFKDLVQQKTKQNFQSENTVFINLDKPSCKVILYGRKANIDAALNSLQIRLNGKFSTETITIPQDFDILMRSKKRSLFDPRQQGAKVSLQKDDRTKLSISGDRNNVLALKAKLEELLATIEKDLHTVTKDTYAWRSVLATDFTDNLLRKYNVILRATSTKPASYERGSIHLVNGAVIHLKRGDIFNETGSAIVSCDNEDMKPVGGIAKSIAERTGLAMDREVAKYLSQFGKLMVGSAMTTSAGDLSSSFAYVIHVVGPIWSGGNANEHNLLSSAIRSVIDQAERNKMIKVVMPSISTGIFSYPKKQAAEIIAKELVQSITHGTTCLKEVVFVDIDDDMIEELRVQFEKLHNNTNTKTFVEATNQWFWQEDNGVYMPYDPDQNNQIELAFHTKQPSVKVVGDLNQVKNGSNYEVDFQTMKQRNLATNWERSVAFNLLPVEKWVKLEAPSLQASTGLVKKVHIHAVPSMGEAVKIMGSRNDVQQAIQETENHIASLTSSVTIDWHGAEPDAKQIQFLKSIGVSFTVDKRKLHLRGLRDTLDKAQLHLMQQAMQIVKYPDLWDDQTQNCQLFVVDAQSQEWASVSSAFKTTMPNAQIVKVERVQNKVIWEDYLGHVQKLRKTTGNITELQLFHGTRNTDPKLIYSDTVGFRNQFSNPQCYWGYGNYFAVNSSYSHSYAHYLPNGSKQMFMATVLVGDYYQAGTKTDSSLKVPPFKLTQNGAEQVRYDSVQGFTGGSTVYITYENGRAYPSYLITYN